MHFDLLRVQNGVTPRPVPGAEYCIADDQPAADNLCLHGFDIIPALEHNDDLTVNNFLPKLALTHITIYNIYCIIRCNYLALFKAISDRKGSMMRITDKVFGILMTGILGMLGVLLPLPVSATVVLGNDAVFGANAIVHDIDNNMDWLNLGFTTPYSYNQVLGEFDAAGVFAGWRVASMADLSSLGSSANVSNGSFDPTVKNNAIQLRDWLCAPCVVGSGVTEILTGIVSDIFIPTGGPYAGQEFQSLFSIGITGTLVDPNYPSKGYYTYSQYTSSGFTGPDNANYEIYLVRDSAAVPEPATLALLGFGLAAFGYMRRKIN